MLSSKFWYRDSTQEWVFEVEFSIDGFLNSTNRFVGKTQLDALKDFRDNFHQVFSEDIQYLEDAGYGTLPNSLHS